MNPSRDDTVAPTSAPRRVLIWRPDADESQVRANVAEAAGVLNVSADEVVAAIDSGELLQGCFVDWAAESAT
jgi:hypothetical protein